MDNYIISDESEVIDAVPPFPENFRKDVKIMKINKNTNFPNVNSFVFKLFENPNVRHVIFEGIGDGADKCVSCVEVLKRKSEDILYQWNGLHVARQVTYWNPLIDGLDRLKVSVDTPVMYILISRDPFPPELACASMQTSQDKKVGRNQSRKAEKVKVKKADTSKNPWNRPDKEQRKRQNQERDKALEEI